MRTYNTPCKQGVDFDQSVEITEHDRDGQVHQIGWIAHEKADEFDDFTESHECQLDHNEMRVVRESKMAQKQDDRIKSEGERGKCCKMQGVATPWLPSIALSVSDPSIEAQRAGK